MVRLATPTLLLIRRWGLMIIGAILVLVGLAWGATSHQVTFTNYPQGSLDTHYYVYNGGQGTYISIPGTSTYFIARKNDFNPPLNTDGLSSVAFIASSEKADIDASLEGQHIDREYIIEKIAFYDGNDQLLAMYTTPEYNANPNPNGFYRNTWLSALWLMVAGTLFFTLPFIYPQLTKKLPAILSINSDVSDTQLYQQPLHTQQYSQQPSQPAASHRQQTYREYPLYSPPQMENDPYQHPPQQ